MVQTSVVELVSATARTAATTFNRTAHVRDRVHLLDLGSAKCLDEKVQMYTADRGRKRKRTTRRDNSASDSHWTHAGSTVQDRPKFSTEHSTAAMSSVARPTTRMGQPCGPCGPQRPMSTMANSARGRKDHGITERASTIRRRRRLLSVPWATLPDGSHLENETIDLQCLAVLHELVVGVLRNRVQERRLVCFPVFSP